MSCAVAGDRHAIHHRFESFRGVAGALGVGAGRVVKFLTSTRVGVAALVSIAAMLLFNSSTFSSTLPLRTFFAMA